MDRELHDLTAGSTVLPTYILFVQDPAGASEAVKFTVSQLKTGMGIVKADVGLPNVPNIDATLRSNHTGTQIATTITEDSTHRFATDAEKTAWNAKQAALVSATNIKTVNGLSLLGSGDLSVGGGTIDPAVVDGSANAPSGNAVFDFFTANAVYYDSLDFGGLGTSGSPINAKEKKVGDLTTLTTTDKTSAVAAINEVKALVGGGGGGGTGDRVRVVNPTSFTLSGSGGLDINISAFTGTYKKITVRFFNGTATVSTDELHMQISNNGTTFDSGSSDYKGVFNAGDSAGTFTSPYIKLVYNLSNTAGETFAGDVSIINAAVTTAKPLFGWEIPVIGADHIPRSIRGGAARDAVKAVTHLRFLSNGGSITGTYEVWGE